MTAGRSDCAATGVEVSASGLASVSETTGSRPPICPTESMLVGQAERRSGLALPGRCASDAKRPETVTTTSETSSTAAVMTRRCPLARVGRSGWAREFG